MKQATEKDCHNDVKSSGVGGGKSHFCCAHHQRAISKNATKVNASSQTEPEVFYFTGNMNGETSAPPKATATNLSKSSPDDTSRSEGTLRLMINNFRNMNNTIRGPPKVVSGVPWKIMVMPRQHVVAKKGTQKCLGFFLQCCPDSYSE